MRLLGRIRRTLGAEVSVREFFDAPTIAGVAERLLAHGHRLPGTGDPAVVPLRAGGGGPLFCVPPPGETSWRALRLAGRLPRNVPLYGLHGEAGAAARLAAAIRAVRPDGPYRLLGWGAGGTLALAVATRLQADGEQVDLLAVANAGPAPGPRLAAVTRFKGDLLLLTALGSSPDEGTARQWGEHVTGLVDAHPHQGVADDLFRPMVLAEVADALTSALPAGAADIHREPPTPAER
jgi:hypothetical protein